MKPLDTTFLVGGAVLLLVFLWSTVCFPPTAPAGCYLPWFYSTYVYFFIPRWASQSKDLFRTIIEGLGRKICEFRARVALDSDRPRNQDYLLSAYNQQTGPASSLARDQTYLLPPTDPRHTPAAARKINSTIHKLRSEMTDMMAEKQFPFLLLPYEIRQVLYVYLVVAFEVLNATPTQDLLPRKKYSYAAALLRVCRQTRFEFHPIFFSRTGFKVSTNFPFYRNMRLPTLTHIRELKVKGQINRHGMRNIKRCFADLENLPNLKDLHITFLDDESFTEAKESAFGLLLNAPFGTPNLSYMYIEIRSKRDCARVVGRYMKQMVMLAIRWWPDRAESMELCQRKKQVFRGEVFEVMEIYRRGYTPGWMTRAKFNGADIKATRRRIFGF